MCPKGEVMIWVFIILLFSFVYAIYSTNISLLVLIALFVFFISIYSVMF